VIYFSTKIAAGEQMKRVISIVFFGALLITGSCFAENEESNQEVRHDLGISIGFEASHITYKEPGVMKQDGAMYGIDGALVYRGWLPLSLEEKDQYMLSLEARANAGKVDYTSNSSGAIDNIDDYMLEFRGIGGYDFYASENSVITPYLGFGYRYLNDDMGGKISTTGAHGYEREITYFYIPLGIDVYNEFHDDWAVKLRLEYDAFIEGDVKSHLGSVPGHYDIENKQRKGYGARGSIALIRKFKYVNLVIEPFARFWSIANSKVTTDPGGTSWIEPKNNSREFGINISAAY